MVFVRILTQDEYTLESFANFPPFSLSVQEFWTRRYSRIAHTILKESIYKPIRLEFSSSAIAFLITFIISGIFHAHMGMVAFGDMSSLVSIFMFFLLHGIACYLEPTIKNQIPKYIRWILTQMFLVITSSFMFGPFIEKGCPFFENNPPPLFNMEWTPKQPVPDFCPR
ncbi:unnamed protein product [Rotaria sp. Silwood2]|nr:unnamed protein product [Rotaria sp. Silwood2]CAF3260942.1 unnamed protein product [Rotaria sp. Silwood2]CAF3575709.1 unnamed protein product [Rotaria sp. Silwood2]CAF4656046.1 unnamed protein product [Rotaria sp. Silwood2]CAF4670387.1 unnamed protein product [Rotaria sp. Silwood2]